MGLMPSDNTVLYNGGYKVLNGYIPFNDYWLVTGPLLDYINAFFFLLFGTTWKSYIFHSSFVNLILAISSFYLFKSLKLSSLYAVSYACLISILFYPVVGTPFVDHHSTFFLILSFYIFIFVVNSKKYLFFSIIPFLLCLSFLSKQTPAVYGVTVIIFLIFMICLLERKKIKEILVSFFLGSVFSLIFLFLFFVITNINFQNFLEQYILYSKTIGEYRIENYNFNLIDVIINYKFINLFNLALTIILIKTFINNKRNLKSILILISSISFSFILIFHQLYTSNQNYIFFLIPFLCGMAHIFIEKNNIKKYILISLISLCIFSVTKYHFRFNEQRKFNELEKVDTSKAIDAVKISSQLKGLKWITYFYPNNPEKEIENLLKVIDILSNDTSKKTLITDYQFIPSVLGIHDYSPNQWHHATVSFPTIGQKYFEDYKNFFISNLKKNEIDFIFETREKEETITELILDKNCLLKERLSEMLIRFEILKDCKDFR